MTPIRLDPLKGLLRYEDLMEYAEKEAEKRVTERWEEKMRAALKD